MKYEPTFWGTLILGTVTTGGTSWVYLAVAGFALVMSIISKDD